ncbi:molecular chaperone [Shewanella intestini]|uniref:Molecular chaperone n=1 Tax=Shewanella intestini TaxID=2017544 RepID=A0ABS5I6A4_9GAMM|nr:MULTISPECIES: molecular chaperone TorD family protein [Shewanella]MBR9729542.1 hypothetical protein [Shewanella intestini]MRG37517.1 hypothetical protein [Shewanella sp. XMDDZSB0408]
MIKKNEEIVAALNVLAEIFYNRPTMAQVQKLIESGVFEYWPQWPNSTKDDSHLKVLAKLKHQLSINSIEDIDNDFLQLFISPKAKKAYPWGSVYTSKVNRLHGETTRAYVEFCKQQQLTFSSAQTEPLDHFGLMLPALSVCLEQNIANGKAAEELLAVHLLPWARRFLECVSIFSTSDYYNHVATLTTLLFDHLESRLSQPVISIRLYK